MELRLFIAVILLFISFTWCKPLIEEGTKPAKLGKSKYYGPANSDERNGPKLKEDLSKTKDEEVDNGKVKIFWRNIDGKEHMFSNT